MRVVLITFSLRTSCVRAAAPPHKPDLDQHLIRKAKGSAGIRSRQRYLAEAAAGSRTMRLSFGANVFDSDTREVFRDGRLASISPKAYALLELLIECRPKAVSKADIHARLWPGIHVSEANLGNLVVELRAALGDHARRPRIIRTVPRFGYAFRAPARPDRRFGEDADTPALVYRLVWGRREITLDPGDNLVGRDRDAVVWIDDESVSRRHAKVTIADGVARVEDLGSKNGTFVGGRRIRSATRLADRESFRVGPATLTLRVLKRTGSTRSTVNGRPAR
jgi:DNA-binding winged helix-turn-helix (wHTH) protein